MKIIYNLEDFVIKEMFRPYQNLIYPEAEENLPEDELLAKIEYDKRIKLKEKEIKKNLIAYYFELYKNPKAYNYVFDRLSNLDFKFYVWLRHPIIENINEEMAKRRGALK